ncbi:MAG TPA: sialate O-acetylesterase [Steroidobacteraceae bacterium]
MASFATLLAASLLLAAGAADADIRLPRLVGDNMVLQRDAPLKLWGWADPGERIRIRFRNQSLRTAADRSGAWSVTLAPLAAGGPDELQLTGHHTLTLHNVLVGDVWLASGQSNMQFPMLRQDGFGGVANADQEVSRAKFPRMRLFLVKQQTAFTPQSDVSSDGWQGVSPATVGPFSAVAYLFGRELFERYHIPIGLIESDWGGTPAECWTSASGLHAFPAFSAAIARLSHLDAQAVTSYRDYLTTRNQWYRLHGREDRGRVAGQDLWASPRYDDRGWPTAEEPQPWPHMAIRDFDGTLWFRKTIQIPASMAGTALRLHLTDLKQSDTTYFNGVKVGATEGETTERNYPVPGALVKAGANLIAVRIAGEYASGDGYVGMLGDAASLYVQIGTLRIPLAGQWSYQSGPDLSTRPAPPPVAEFMSQHPTAPTLLYDAMIAPLTRYRIRGVIWYQGEANTDRAAQYQALFPALIRDWRAHWGYQFPFLFVQLAGYGPDQSEPADYPWAQLRQAQSDALALPGTAMAVAIDVGNARDIHPTDKQDVAHRLALGAERVAYGEQVDWSGPTYRSMRIEGDRIRLQFDHAGAGLELKGAAAEARGFAIAGADGHFVWARGRLDGSRLLVWSNTVKQPRAVRYDWSNTPDGNLYNGDGLPAAPFRTDAAPLMNADPP